MRIHDVHDFAADQAARELLGTGFTAVDDISGQSVEYAEAELMDALGHATDAFDVVIDESVTPIGPVFVFRNPARLTLDKARSWVLARRPAL